MVKRTVVGDPMLQQPQQKWLDCEDDWLSKRQSPTTVLSQTTLAQTITLYGFNTEDVHAEVYFHVEAVTL